MHKELYGFKQAPRAWFSRFGYFLLSHGFHNSCADYSMFVYSSGGHYLFLLLYMDDIVLTGSNPRLISWFSGLLHSEFSISDLGELHYFLGVRVTCLDDGLHLSQSKYA